MARRLGTKRRKKLNQGVFPREGSWWIRWTELDGKRVSRCIGNYPDAYDDASAAYWVEKRRVNYCIAAPPPPPKAVSYSELCDDALLYSRERHRDVRMFAARLTATRAFFGNRAASGIRPAEIRKWLTDQGWAPGTRNRHKAVMSKAFKLGIEAQKVSVNPARLVPQYREPVGRLRFLSETEEGALRAALVKRPSCTPQLDIALMTGMRKGEQYGLTWPDVDLEAGHIHLSATKNGSSRYVFLNSHALAVLTTLKAEHLRLNMRDDSKLFLNARNQPISDPRMWFNAACIEAGLTGISWHSLRHTFASRLTMTGAGLKTVQDLCGHKTISMAARYSHLSPQHQRDALETLVAR